MKSFLIGVASVVTMLLLAGTLLLAAGGIHGIGSANRTDVVDRNLSLSGTPTITIADGNASILITRGEENVVAIHAVKRASSDALLRTIRVGIEQTGDQIQIGATYDRPSWRGLFHGSDRSVSYEIRVPARATIAPVRSSNGNIAVTGVTGPLDLQTSNGAITVRGVDGDVSARASNGTIDVIGTSGTLTLTASNGPVEIQEVRASGLNVQAANGRITFAGSLAPGSENLLTTSNGSVTITLPPDLAANVDLKTSNGTINVGFPLATQPDGEISRTGVQGMIGGGGTRLAVRTSNGSITIARQGS